MGRAARRRVATSCGQRQRGSARRGAAAGAMIAPRRGRAGAGPKTQEAQMALLIGTPRADALTGGAEADLILGLGGADGLVGGTGADTILGGGGNDVINGQRGVPFDFTMDDNLIL